MLTDPQWFVCFWGEFSLPIPPTLVVLAVATTSVDWGIVPLINLQLIWKEQLSCLRLVDENRPTNE